MKKIIILALLTVLTGLLAFNVNAETYVYEEQNNWFDHRYDDDPNGTIDLAEYVPLSKFRNTTISYKDHKQTQIKGEILSSSLDIDYYSFYVPYDTKLKVNTYMKIDGSSKYNTMKFKLVEHNENGEVYHNYNDFYSGKEIKAGYYSIGINKIDNKVKKTSKFLFFNTTKTYYVTDYRFTLTYADKVNEPNTEMNIYDAKLNNISGAVWINDYDFSNLRYQYTDARGNTPLTAFKNDLENYTGYSNIFNNQFIDKRVYLFNQEIADGLNNGLRGVRLIIEQANEKYEEKIRNGYLGSSSVTKLVDTAYTVNDVVTLSKSGYDIVKAITTTAGVASGPVGLTVAGIIFSAAGVINNLAEEEFNDAQKALLVASITTAIVSDDFDENYLKDNPEAYLKYFNILNPVLAEMLENDGDIERVYETVDGMQNALNYMEIGPDDYAYFDILAQYYFNTKNNPQIVATEDYYTRFITEYTPIISKHYFIRDYNSMPGGAEEYLKQIEGSDDNEVYFDNLSASELNLKETIYDDYSIFKRGHYEYIEMPQSQENGFDPNIDIRMISGKSLYHTTSIGSRISESTITNGVYVYDSYHGFLKVHVTYYNVSSSGTKYAYFYVNHPVTGQRYTFSDSTKYGEFKITITVKPASTGPTKPPIILMPF